MIGYIISWILKKQTDLPAGFFASRRIVANLDDEINFTFFSNQVNQSTDLTDFQQHVVPLLADFFMVVTCPCILPVVLFKVCTGNAVNRENVPLANVINRV